MNGRRTNIDKLPPFDKPVLSAAEGLKANGFGFSEAGYLGPVSPHHGFLS